MLSEPTDAFAPAFSAIEVGDRAMSVGAELAGALTTRLPVAVRLLLQSPAVPVALTLNDVVPAGVDPDVANVSVVVCELVADPLRDAGLKEAVTPAGSTLVTANELTVQDPFPERLT